MYSFVCNFLGRHRGHRGNGVRRGNVHNMNGRGNKKWTRGRGQRHNQWRTRSERNAFRR